MINCAGNKAPNGAGKGSFPRRSLRAISTKLIGDSHRSFAGSRRAALATVLSLVPRPAKSDELLLQATYHGSNVHDGCHSIFDKFVGSGSP